MLILSGEYAMATATLDLPLFRRFDFGHHMTYMYKVWLSKLPRVGWPWYLVFFFSSRELIVLWRCLRQKWCSVVRPLYWKGARHKVRSPGVYELTKIWRIFYTFAKVDIELRGGFRNIDPRLSTFCCTWQSLKKPAAFFFFWKVFFFGSVWSRYKMQISSPIWNHVRSWLEDFNQIYEWYCLTGFFRTIIRDNRRLA